jgi:hypothetical protein
MKNTGKIFGIIVLLTVILSMAACATSAPGGTSIPSGTYRYKEVPSCTITFNQNNFTMFIPASLSSSGKNDTASGTFTVSGIYLFMTVFGEPVTFIITDNKTLIDDDDGSVWIKQ